MITCFIRCEIDPFKVAAFDTCARNRGLASAPHARSLSEP